jgi:GAF domain-containing protein
MMPSLTNQQTKIFEKLTRTADRSLSFENFCEAALQEICRTIDWDYGEIWMMQKDCSTLNLSPIWYLSSSIQEAGRCLSWQQFRVCSLNFTLHLGEGLPGRACLSQRPEWVPDVSIQSEGYFLRNQIAKAFSVRAGLGLPILAGQKVLAILVCFKATSCQADLEIMQWLQTVIQHLNYLAKKFKS